MNSRVRLIFLFFAAFILVVDSIVFTGLLHDFPVSGHPAVIAAYWIVPAGFIGGLYLLGRRFLAGNRTRAFSGFFVFAGIFIAFYVPRIFYSAFLLLEYLLKIAAFPIYHLLSGPETFGEFFLSGPLNFISLLILPVCVLSFFVIIDGMLRGRFRFLVRPVEIQSPDLPPDFDGFRIVQISDLHLGSLHGQQHRIRKAIDLVNRESPDLILFTGDLVNNVAEEADGWTGLLSELKSRCGNYSILGNHDYGEYYNWTSEEARLENMNRLYRVHRESGFILLRNQSVKIESGTGGIYLAGVENWGLPPFKQYGHIGKAMENIPENAFTILLSHDPSHWDAEVLGKTRVQLTLSGHTHGMQFGIRTRRFRWSPIQWKYPRWIGLYQQGDQYLYVNPGLGYIGYAGRIWIPPEITLITLKRST
jgi:predicted MPP superfamily phosphohydrolase